MKKIKIMHITFSLDIGGAEMVILDLCKNIDQEKFLPMVCCLSEGGSLRKEFQKLNIPVFTVKKKIGKDFYLLFKLYMLFRRERIDIIHPHLSYMWLYSVLPAKLARVKGILFTEHSNKIKPSKLFVMASKQMQKFTDIITVNSKQIKDCLIIDEKLQDGNITIVPNGLDFKNFEKKYDRIQERKILNLNNNTFAIVCVSRLYPPKDPLTLVKAIHKISNYEVKLFIVGGGVLEQELREYIISNGLEKSIVFLGFRRDIPKLLQAMDLFVLSSLKEGQSISIMEAMASALPVIATGTGGTPELVIDGETGFLVPPKDSDSIVKYINRCILDRNMASALGLSGQNRIKTFYSIEKIIKMYQEQYTTIFNK